jgi:hypothetical protein
MSDKLYQKLCEAWEHMCKENIPAPASPAAPVKDPSEENAIAPVDVVVVSAEEGNEIEDGEKGEPASGPTYSSGGEPGVEGWYEKRVPITAVISCKIANAYSGNPVPVTEDNEDMIEDGLKETDNVHEILIPAIKDYFKNMYRSYDVYRRYTVSDEMRLYIPTQPLDGSGNPIKIVMQFEFITDEPPDPY